MEAITKFGCPRVADLASAAISLAIVFGTGIAHAEGLPIVAPSRQPSLLGEFSQVDLDRLEYASAYDATAARLAAIGDEEPVSRRPLRAMEVRELPAPQVEADLFPHSGRILPLLVVRPQAATAVVQAPAAVRPGVVQPVGVSRSRTRAFAQSERTGR